FLPFGYEYNAKTGVNNYKFGTYRRGDSTEGGLDYAKFRYYSSQYGRFMTPDPTGLVAADLSNPQSLNQYAYTANNPTNSLDPLGLRMTQIWMEVAEGGSCHNLASCVLFVQATTRSNMTGIGGVDPFTMIDTEGEIVSSGSTEDGLYGDVSLFGSIFLI